jgi:hypothetical protein
LTFWINLIKIKDKLESEVFMKHQLICEKGSRIVCEDIAHITNRAFWVLDGATPTSTPLVDPQSDARWFVHTWNAFLLKEIPNGNKSLKTIVFEGIQWIKQQYEALVFPFDPANYPSCSLVIGRVLSNQELEIYSLGDCSFYIKKGEHLLSIGAKDDIRLFEKRSLDALKKVRTSQPDLPLKDAVSFISPIFKENRTYKNKSNGYSIISDDMEAVGQGIHHIIPIDSSTELLLGSDGFFAIIDLYQAFSPNELFHFLQDHPLDDVYTQLRQIEDQDPEAYLFPRFKKGDDASAIYINFND